MAGRVDPRRAGWLLPVLCLAALQALAAAEAPPADEDPDIELAMRLERAFQKVAARAKPTVVSLTVITGRASWPEELQRLHEQGGGMHFESRFTGSGVIIDPSGTILTNEHVVRGAEQIRVELHDGTVFRARLSGTDARSDLAVIQPVKPLAKPLAPAMLADSDEVRVGQWALAVGNPFELSNTLTVGVVSARGRSLPARGLNQDVFYGNLIQTDAAINPGNSGGPLFDMAGNVVGVNTAILSQSGTGSGVGFAIPSNTVRRIVPYLIEFGSYEHSWLGISGMTVQPAQREAMNLDSAFKGVMVTLVSPNSPAERGGLRGTDRAINTPLGQIPVNGDIITAIDGQPIEDMNDLIMYLEDGTLPGDTVSLSVWRDGQQREVQVQLGARPS